MCGSFGVEKVGVLWVLFEGLKVDVGTVFGVERPEMFACLEEAILLRHHRNKHFSFNICSFAKIHFQFEFFSTLLFLFFSVYKASIEEGQSN